MESVKAKIASKKIILIEDSRQQRDFMKKLIIDFSTRLQVVAISNNGELVDELFTESRKFDAILTDYDYSKFEDINIKGIEDGVDLLKVLDQHYGLNNFKVGIYSQVNSEFEEYLEDLLPEHKKRIHIISKDNVSNTIREESYAGLFNFLNDVAPQSAYLMFDFPNLESIHFSKVQILLRTFLKHNLANLDFKDSSQISRQIGKQEKKVLLPDETLSISRKIAFRDREIKNFSHNLRIEVLNREIKTLKIREKVVNLSSINIQEHTDNEIFTIVHCLALNIISKYENNESLDSIKIPQLGPFDNYLSVTIVLLLKKNNQRKELKEKANKLLKLLSLSEIKEFYWGELNQYRNDLCDVTLKTYFNSRKRPAKIRTVKGSEFKSKGILEGSYFFLLVLVNRFQHQTSIVEPATLLER